MNTTTATDNELDELNARRAAACREALSPEWALARNLQTMVSNGGYSASALSLPELTAMLETQNQAAVNGDLSHVRRLLSNQVTMLERLTAHLFSRAMGMGAVVDVYERYLRLAFRAQAQCVRTATLLKKMTDSAAPEAARKTPQRESTANERGQAVAPETRTCESGQGNEAGVFERGTAASASASFATAGKDAHPTLGRVAKEGTTNGHS